MRILNRVTGLVAATLLAAVIFVTMPSTAKCENHWSLAGTWIVWADIQSGVRVPSLHTYHSDGTVTLSDVFMFGGLPGIPIRTTPMYGVWEKTGRTAFTTTNLSLVYDAASSLLIGFARARAEVSFTEKDPDKSFARKDADRVSGTVYVEFLQCSSPVACADPQAPGAAWMSFPGMPASFPVTATRLDPVPTP